MSNTEMLTNRGVESGQGGLKAPTQNLCYKKSKKNKSNEKDVELVEFTSFLKNDDQVSSYTGQILPMTRQHFQDLVNVEKLISDMTSINMKWATEMKLLDNLRKIAQFEKDEEERSQPKNTSSSSSPQQKRDRKKRVNNKINV
ncbi:hypothetical protein Ddye_025456 [Dipteronia dyeriana]|uniref:Uncharacterized protein n=1 Tax=Dipteronia dyeriana TaxID=168575 RepID=A0AAD9TKE8_9ROSI|nr:hypothetical protein Ddye_025456 [Dipteronia dyeriana]